MYVDTGGADTSGLFPHYVAKPDAIETSAEGLDRHAANIQAFSTEINSQHQRAVASVSGEITEPISTAAQTPTAYSNLMLGRTYVSSGSIRLFGQGVSRFNTKVDKLNEEYRQALATEFGVAEATYPEDATPAHKTAADETRDNKVMEARVAKLQSLVQRYLDARDALDLDAEASAAKINAGATDQVLQDLYGSGVLPTSVTLAYPNLSFTTKKVPPDMADLDPAEVEEYLREHPEVADSVVNGLLTKEGLTDLEQAIVEAQGRIDAELLKEGMGKTGQDALDDIAAAQTRLQLINDHVAQTGVLNDAAHSYTVAWMNEVGSENLANLSSVVQTAIGSTMTGVPQDVEGMVNQYLTPVGNAILNLSNEKLQDTVLPEGQGTTYRYDFNGDGVIDKNDMPQAIRQLMSMRIGENDGQSRYGEVDEDGHGSLNSIENLEEFNGWADLLASSTVEGGEEFSVDLAEQAIEAKQDMNAILVSANRDADIGGMTQHELAEFRATMDDAGTSDLLSVVSRNQDASSALLIDDVHRQELLGLNWNDDEGAADVIRAGTDRTTGDGGGGQEQAEAALAVLKDVGADGVQYEVRMSEGVSDAVVDTGITWMETFTRHVGNDEDLGVDLDAEDAIGRDLKFSLNLSDEQQARFLQFISSTGDDDALRFRAAANTYAQTLIANALASENGHGPTVDQAMYAAGRLDGAITAADYEWAIDQDEYRNDEAKAAQAADTRRSQGLATFLKMGLDIATTIGGAAAPPAAAFLGVGNAIVGPAIDAVLGGEEKVALIDIAETRGELLAADHSNAAYWRDYMLLTAANEAGIVPTDLGEFDADKVYQTDSSGELVLDENGNPIIKNYNELDPDALQALGVARGEAFGEWERQHPDEDLSEGRFSEGRNSKVTDSRWDNDDRPDDGWNNDRTAEKRLYGDNVPKGYGDDPFEDGPREQYPDEGYQVDPTKKRR